MLQLAAEMLSLNALAWLLIKSIYNKVNEKAVQRMEICRSKLLDLTLISYEQISFRAEEINSFSFIQLHFTCASILVKSSCNNGIVL